MLKSPEEYLSSLEFDAGSQSADKQLNAEERAFVEKYMGLDAFLDLPEAAPESVPLLQAVPTSAPPRPVLVAEREIVIAPPREEIAAEELDKPKAAPVALLPVLRNEAPLQLVVTPASLEEKVETNDAVCDQDSASSQEALISAPEPAEAATPERPESAAVSSPLQAPEIKEQVEEPRTVAATEEIAKESVTAAQAARIVPKSDTAVELSPAALLQKAETQLKEKLKQEAEVQMVSFFVGGQIFLLPVAGIQEVLRHMELIKVPQAPYFVAGVINLRGRVTPVVHLSTLVTNAEIPPYTESNFIIITGTETLQLGLIIDKVSSMHMVPQNKIIWNAESKLAEAAEFLSAIVDLDDRVCGVVSPEMIIRLILPES